MGKFIGLWLLLVVAGCGQKTAGEVEFQPNECRKWPVFATRLGYTAGPNTAFMTTDKKIMGLVLMRVVDSVKRQVYQHPSWKTGGWLAPVHLDNAGNLFTAPAPYVNVLYNRLEDQNTIYKVNGETGEMAPFVQLPKPEANNNENPFGIMALTYMCENNRLYVSSVAGSTREKEKGVIYAVDAESGKIKDKLTGFDPFGVGICYIEGKRRLYFGQARNSDIYAIDLTASGQFVGSPQLIGSIAQMGPRGDDKVKKISFSRKGDMEVDGYEFNFNLIAPTEKQVTKYYFRYSPNAEKWEPIGERQFRR